jgi:hypothetical protein
MEWAAAAEILADLFELDARRADEGGKVRFFL